MMFIINEMVVINTLIHITNGTIESLLKFSKSFKSIGNISKYFGSVILLSKKTEIDQRTLIIVWSYGAVRDENHLTLHGHQFFINFQHLLQIINYIFLLFFPLIFGDYEIIRTATTVFYAGTKVMFDTFLYVRVF